MAYQSLFQMTIQDASGNYYSAVQNADASWAISTTPLLSYLDVLPDGWDEIAVTWERDLSYLGVFRSMTSAAYKFSKDGRAIIKSIRSNEGIRGYGQLTIWIINESDFNYSIFYRSQLNFQTFHDYAQQFLCEIGTLDSGLIRDLHSYGDTDINIPIWAPDGLGGWIPYYSNEWVQHNGLKLLYNANFISEAKPTNTIHPNDNGAPINLYGFNHGSRTDGRHWLPSLQQYNIVQNNGTTTYIGNDILQPSLLQRNQVPYYEQTMWGSTESRPYTTENYLLKDAIPYGLGAFDMNINLSSTFADVIQYANGSIYSSLFIGFVLFEVDQYNYPQGISGSPAVGNMAYINLIQAHLPNMGSPYTMGPTTSCVVGGNPPATGIIDVNGFFNITVPITINPDKCYVLGIILDDDVTGVSGFQLDNIIELSTLQISFASRYDYGLSGVPIPAPKLNPSVFAGYRLHQLWELLVPFLASTQTDSNGFPIPVTTDYVGLSDFLSNPALAAIGDCVPYQIIISSAYCMHDLQGQSYITLSVNKLFDFCKKVLGCGMGLTYDTNGVAVGLRIEDLNYFFDDTTMILDLGYDISEFEYMQGGAEMGIGANLKLGYSKADTNTDFGVDPFNTGLFFNTPITEIPGVMDFEEDSILTEQYAIEKIRQQKVNQPVGSSFDPANPSSDNQCVALYIEATTAPYILPDPPTYPFQPYDPDNNPVGVIPYLIEQLSTAQSNDPTAAIAPYINGLYYPDTAINVKISPARALLRDVGAYIHSICDKMDSLYLTFRNTYVMQFNNQTLALTGMESNLQVGAGAPVITEMSDKLIGDLPDKLFLPVPVRFISTSARKLYSVLNTNANGYIRFYVKNEGYGYTERKIFLMKATQKATLAGNISTVFEGLLLPDQTI